MRRESSGPLLSSHTFCSIKWFYKNLEESEGPNQTAQMRKLILNFAAHICSKTFPNGEAHMAKLWGRFGLEGSLTRAGAKKCLDKPVNPR